MSQLPRLAVGTIQKGADGATLAWALMDALEQVGQRVQSFFSRACFAPLDGATAITGQGPRHLDTWLMSPDLCRDVLVRGSKSSDIALVEGRFAEALAPEDLPGGDLAMLCDWLDLPRLAIVDASQLSCCQLPARPARLDGILLDRVSDGSELIRLQTLFEGLWGVPVLGALRTLPAMRRALGQLQPGSRPSQEICCALGTEFSATSQLERICRIAAGRELPITRTTTQPHFEPLSLQIAVAYDDAFHCYFPDTMDLLELKGATLCDFSPLRDERLPAGTDLVYFGCGRPDLYAHELMENQCMMQALRNHLCGGKRMYAECGGLSYLGQYLDTLDGRRLPMAGILPIASRANPNYTPPRATELTLFGPSWLGTPGSKVRGYLNSFWSIEPTGPTRSLCTEAAHRWDLVGIHELIGSRLHLNFAAQPELAERFFEPCASAGEPAIAASRFA